MSNNICLISAAILILSSCSPDKKSSNPDIDSLFARYNHPNSPGCALAVVQDGRLVYSAGYGMANLEYDIPITSSTVFDIASVSKQFAGLAISMLVEQGAISLEDDIHKYLPDVPDFGKKITIDHLVHHTSGIRDWPQTLNVAGWRWDEDFTYTDIMRMVRYQKDLDFAPGERYSYSNTGYNLLAAIVEQVSGKSFKSWTDENIFAPLNMSSSHFLDDHKSIIKNMAYSYSGTGSGWVKSPSALTAVASSSLFTNVDDLVKWVIHFNRKVAEKDPVYVRMLDQGVLNDGSKIFYAFGLAIETAGGLKLVSHTGGWAGYRTAIWNLPEEKLSVIVLSNASDFDSSGKAREVVKLILKDKFKEDAAVVDSTKELPTTRINLAFAKKCTGTYKLGDGWYVTITLENDTLRTQANGEPKFDMLAKSDSVYWIEAYGASMTFREGPSGDVNSLRYKWINNAPRIEPLGFDQKTFGSYAGTFYSKELMTEYEVKFVKESLSMNHFRHGEIELQPDPVAADQFTSRIGAIRFSRDKTSRVNGLFISGGRVKNLWFEKR